MAKKDRTHRDAELGTAIALLRTVRGLSQADLALAAGVRTNSLSEYERGRKLPELETLHRLLDVLGLPLAAIDRTYAYVDEVRTLRALSPHGPGPVQATAGAGRPSPLAGQIEAISNEAGQAVVRLSRAVLTMVFADRLPGGAGPGSDDGEPEDGAGAPEAVEPPPPQPVPVSGAELWARLAPLPFERQKALLREDAAFAGRELCEHLCDESVRVAAADAVKALELGDLAVLAAERCPGDAPWLPELGAYAWAHLGNARRVGSDLTGAEEAFDRADHLWSRRPAGAASRYEVRFLDLKASLRRAQRRLPEALDLLDRALAADRAHETTARLLLKKSTVFEVLGDLDGAIDALRQAAPHVDAQGDPRQVLCLRHNLLDTLTNAARFAEAEALLPEVRELARQHAGALDRLRLRWVEGRIAAGLGNTEQAIKALDLVRRQFAQHDIGYDTALVSLELATLYAREGQTGQVKALARHMVPIFRANDVHREALAALAIFRQAAEREQLTAELAASLTTYLQRARHDPALRFETGAPGAAGGA